MKFKPAAVHADSFSSESCTLSSCQHLDCLLFFCFSSPTPLFQFVVKIIFIRIFSCFYLFGHLWYYTVFTVDANDRFKWEWMLNRDRHRPFLCMIIHMNVDIPYRRCKLLLKRNWVDKFLFILLRKTLNSIKNIDISCWSPIWFRVYFGCSVCCFV